MKLRINRLGGVAFLIVLLGASAWAQSTGTISTAQIQNLTRTAEKAAIISGGVGLGVTVIGLALRHHKHGAHAKKTDNQQGAAAQHTRGSKQAASPDLQGLATKAPSNETKTTDESKVTSPTAAPLRTQTGSWTW